jgi:hypothetical protein
MTGALAARIVSCTFLMRYHASGIGPPASGRPGREYRGSRKRVRRLKFRDNWPVELWFVVAVVLFTLFVVVPWLVQHPLPDHPHVETTITH